jgi:hypothetical protein
LSVTSQARFARTVWRASKVTTAPSRSKRFQQLSEVAGLVVLDADLEMVQQVPAVFGGAEQVDPGAVGAAGPAGGLAVQCQCP